ncbi:SDR family oxidoreductase [Kitasatospora sp. RG8]|uniref:alpha/beta fold hydrolase n=1 Tax=Kitasatospora sp. RG8 TaxID=2820815 RepID=UPI001ADF108C|nr:alpha/beta fold hydrolase [Kitasatospora sp. RG8]MBP0453241.1 SDR family oxidoreductase [Kitasatospora sp. RG8]
MNATPPTAPTPAPTPPDSVPLPPRTLVLGATGFLGRWLVLELLGRGEPVAAGVRGGRGTAREHELRSWLRAHGADDTALTTVAADLTRPGLGLSPEDDARLENVRDVHNLAALYRFGLSRAEAHAANVAGALHALDWAAGRPHLRRLVHLSGYRVGRDATPRHPLPAAEADALYARLGAYEASKQLGDAAVRVTAARLGVPLTTVNPSSVVGHSVTGEAGQYLGLADLVRQLWYGRLPLLPGSARTFLPVVAVDHLARFLAAVPGYDTGPAHAHTVLDPATPPLPELIALLAEHLGVPAPRRLIPVGLVRRLPRALTGADPETLTFLSEDTYDTASADRLAHAVGLHHPPVAELLRRWATRLVTDGFGAPPSGGALAGRFTDVAGGRSYLVGDGEAPRFVLLHGPGSDADVWRAVTERLDAPALAADLPGLGRSSPVTVPDDHWLAELLAPVRTRPVLVAHSASATTALRHATTHPDTVAGVVLVAPSFVGPHTGGPHTGRPAIGEPATTSTPPASHRPGAGKRAARRLRRAGCPAEQAEAAALMRACPVPVTVIPGVPETAAPPATTRPAGSLPLPYAAELADDIRASTANW